MVRIKLENLAREFADGTHVGPLNLMVEEGELLTLLGPSGAGKTTTLRMIAGFIKPDRGRIFFGDQEMTDIHPRDRNIGMVFQSIALFPHMKVYQNISLGLELAGWDNKQTIQRVEELSELLGIRQLLHRRINEISGGEAQRVALARALARQPNLLLLDEPLSSLDPQLSERLRVEIRRIQKKLGVTTIYVTHSQDEAFSVSDRVAVLNDGIICQVGSPQELYDLPESEFVAKFIGHGNVLVGAVVEQLDGKTIVDVGGKQLDAKGKGETGEIVKLSIKPEDITFSLSKSGDLLDALIVEVTPQLGEYRIIFEYSGNLFMGLIKDDKLAKALREKIGKTAYFGIESKSAVILKTK